MGTGIEITARKQGSERVIRYSIEEVREQQEMFATEDESPLASRLDLKKGLGLAALQVDATLAPGSASLVQDKRARKSLKKRLAEILY